jgi:hypothetical protein
VSIDGERSLAKVALTVHIPQREVLADRQGATTLVIYVDAPVAAKLSETFAQIAKTMGK